MSLVKIIDPRLVYASVQYFRDLAAVVIPRFDSSPILRYSPSVTRIYSLVFASFPDPGVMNMTTGAVCSSELQENLKTARPKSHVA